MRKVFLFSLIGILIPLCSFTQEAASVGIEGSANVDYSHTSLTHLLPVKRMNPAVGLSFGSVLIIGGGYLAYEGIKMIIWAESDEGRDSHQWGYDWSSIGLVVGLGLVSIGLIPVSFGTNMMIKSIRRINQNKRYYKSNDPDISLSFRPAIIKTVGSESYTFGFSLAAIF